MKPWIPLAALALALSPLAFVHPVRVQGRSMEPLLKDGELRWALRSWCVNAPKRGEVWLIQGPEGPALKRVVGLPGETVEQKSGDLWVNGHPLSEAYIHRSDRGEGGPWNCGQGFFLAGDNRTESQDCRAWGSLPLDAFQGRVINP